MYFIAQLEALWALKMGFYRIDAYGTVGSSVVRSYSVPEDKVDSGSLPAIIRAKKTPQLSNSGIHLEYVACCTQMKDNH